MTEYYDSIIKVVSDINFEIFEIIEKAKGENDSASYFYKEMNLNWVEFSSDGFAWEITCLGMPVINSEEFYFDEDEGQTLGKLREIIITFFIDINETIGLLTERILDQKKYNL